MKADLNGGVKITLDMSLENHNNNQASFWGVVGFPYFYSGHFNNHDNNFVLQIGSPYVKYGVNDELRHVHIYDSENQTCSYDSLVTNARTLFWTTVREDNITIFQRTNGELTPEPSVNKMYNYQVIKNEVLIMNLIPVRKGQEGYMYDKVSGQLFGNSGTGDFVLGPDVGE